MKIYFTALEIAEMLGVSRSQGYNIVKRLNTELKSKGYLVVSGRVSSKYFAERYYGSVDDSVKSGAV